ncbi:hypothetical protein X777_12654 [Ooceraea biroi]|uniref:DRBM domain-containing protein n=1 Tax=Ooceraea biroi TaxID=2015173 RepID=A0A026W024_OOCBI|nr:hypothetical protein X777_12654 [Ooceraea biroi]
MSSGSDESFADTTMHGKLKAPRSLQGVEDAEVIWDAITQRFPNAAPLLCEMETVIERAEDLLQQLKIPCTEENDTSSSFHTPDSRESNATISIGSDIESFAEETDVKEHPEATENVETSHIPHDVHEVQVDFECEHRSEQSIQGYHLNPSPRVDEVVEDFKTDSENKCRDTQGESDTNATEENSADKGLNASSEERLMAMIREQSSLEGWAKVADDALREWHEDVEAIDVSTNENDSEAEINISKNIDDCLLMINNDSKCDETDIHTSDKSDDTKVVAKSIQNSISRSSVTIRDHRSPLTILEEYAKRCKVPIKYEYKSKPNLYVINGDLCGFRAMSCAETQDQAKNELATKILWMVAEHQMDGSKLSSSICGLLDLSREEMLEIIAFNKDELKNASQKLYKFCLERGVPTPEYSIRNIKTTQGFMYVAECAALAHVGVGQGLRKDSAKIAAAENLYPKCTHEVEQQI